MLHGAWRHVTTRSLRAIGLEHHKFSSALRIVPISDQRAFSTRREKKVIFSGIQPTGVPHLGNYLGALRQWVDLQDKAEEGDRLLYSIVDLHAITVPQDADQLRRWRRESLAVLLAVGLDPERCTIFYQSGVPEHTELMWILSCMASMGYLSRMTQWKSKLLLSDNASPLDPASAKVNLRLGLFSYPVLQAADIVLYGTTHVPVGEDQVQHLEFTRDCVDSFNSLHGEALVKPQILLSSAKRVMSLKDPHLKMSKSHADPRSRIQINDQPEAIAKKIRLALTDSVTGISYEPEARPGVSNLLDIMSHVDTQRRSPQELARAYNALSMREFKGEVTTSINGALFGIREKYNRLISSDDSHYLEDVCQEGSRRARARAADTMTRVRNAMGLE